MKICQIADNDPIIIVLCQNDFSETLSKKCISMKSRHTLEVGYLDKSYVLFRTL